MRELKEAYRYYVKHPWTFLGELLGCLGIFFLGYVFLIFGHAMGLS